MPKAKGEKRIEKRMSKTTGGWLLPKAKKPFRGGCMLCGGTHDLLAMDTELYNSFGGYSVTKNGEDFYSAKIDDFKGCKKLKDIEKEARKEPDSDWRVRLDLPLRAGVWQRQGENKWVLVETGMGFA